VIGKLNKMYFEYFKIKDRCRAGLLLYLSDACRNISLPDPAQMLDIGCGTGVSTIWLAGHFSGTITAIDTNHDALEFLRDKILTRKLRASIKPCNISFFELETCEATYDLILAEGFLNVVGFKKGFDGLMKWVNENGYIVIHDEVKDPDFKLEYFHSQGFRLVEIIEINETFWWNNYLKPLENELSKISNDKLFLMFENERQELESYRMQPQTFRSIYYVLQNNGLPKNSNSNNHA
jgi:cyclopropane fatty-acyl-phospholipid synthase-like methyltransferase